jgi:hypothetical protein
MGSVPVHFYHLWRGGEWRAIADEHYAALRAAKFTGEVHVITVDAGFEDVTLRALRKACESLPGTTPVLYAHAKGAFHPSPANDTWRRRMTEHSVTRWRQSVRELEQCDVSAWAWARYPLPHAPGNFWWAAAGYLRGLPYLPPLTEMTRTDAETWVGQDRPTVRPGEWR